MAAAVNYQLVIACALIVVSLLLYFFYWNRLLASFINVFLRVWGWKAGTASIWIQFRSIHFSILSGRILLRDLRYHQSDMTVKAVACSVEWRYWIRRPMEAEDLAHHRQHVHRSEVEEDDYKPTPFPCRVHVTLRGMELYMYNRITSFDTIVSEMERKASEANPPQLNQSRGAFSIHRIFSKTSAPADTSTMPTYPPSSRAATMRNSDTIQRLLIWVRSQLPSLDPKDILPLSIEITKAVIVCGNAATPSLMTIDIRQGDGVFGIIPSRSKHDINKQIFDFKFRHVSAQFLENEDYQGTMVETGKRIREKLARLRVSRLRWLSQLAHSAFVKLWGRHTLATALKGPEKPTHKTKGSLRIPNPLKRHGHHETLVDEPVVEYAIERKWLEAPSLEVAYYVDNVGAVPLPTDGIHAILAEHADDGLDPEWGIDIVVHRGNIKYGPWADRQRAELQRAFFPPTYQDTKPALALKPGDKRRWTALKVFVELRGTSTLALPFREASKDWQWDVTSGKRHSKRDAAMLNLKVSDGSTISYMTPMVPGPNGYEPVVEVHLDSIALSSSLNDTQFIQAEACRVRGELPSPLGWKDHREWKFAVTLRTPTVYLLRDHINMFTDLAKDWSSGPAAPFHTWIPMLYSIDFTMRNYTIHLYANDFNIIDTPLLKDTNVLLTLRGDMIKNKNMIPSDTYSPRSTAIPFFVEAATADVYMTLPRWNTHWSNDDKAREHIGKTGLLRIDGSYTYDTVVAPGNVEQLTLNIHVEDLVYKAFGWTIRSFMTLRENYFGGFTHFQTLSEHLSKRGRSLPTGDPVYDKYRPGTSNPFQVVLSVVCVRSVVALASDILGIQRSGEREDSRKPGLGTCLVIQVPREELVLRTNEDFMEMNITLPVMQACIEPSMNENDLFHNGYVMPRAMMVVDGFDVVANRLFGPPPEVHTYVCIWEITIGTIKASATSTEAASAVAALQSFGFNMKDPVNAPAADLLPLLLPDATFLSVSVSSICAVWHADNTAVEARLPKGFTMQSNDIGESTYKKIAAISLPAIEVRMLAYEARDSAWSECAHVYGELGMNILSAPHGWRQQAATQRAFLVEQDGLTGRASDLLNKKRSGIGGRAVVHNGGYTSRLWVPHSGTGIKRHTASKAQVSPPTVIPSEVSEGSDSEPPLSERQRDAQVARARPSQHTQHIGGILSGHDDDSISEGDESDDTDFVTVDEHSPAGAEEPLQEAVHASMFCKYFAARHLSQPSLWSSSPFTPTKIVHIMASGVSPPRELTSLQATSHDQSGSGGNEEDRGRTIIDFRIPTLQTTLVIPVLIGAALDLVKDVLNKQKSPETEIDTLMLRRLDALKDKEPSNTMILKLQVDHVDVQSLLCISTRARQENRDYSRPSCFDMRLSGLSLELRKSLKGTSGRARLSSLSTDACDISLVKQAARTISLRSTSAIRTGLTNMSSSFHDGIIGFSTERVFCDLSHRAPQTLLNMANGLTQTTADLLPTFKKYSQIARDTRLSSTLRILEHSRNQTIIDQLATTQPAYFVQQGYPYQIRTDVTFRALLYLRNCLAETPLQLQNGWMELPQLSEEDGHRFVASLLSTLGEPASEDARSAIWNTIYPTEKEKPSPTVPSPAGAHIAIETLSLSVLDPDGDTPTNLSISSIHFDTKWEFGPLIGGGSTTPKQPPIKSELHSMMKVTALVLIDKLGVTIRPHVLDFIRKTAELRFSPSVIKNKEMNQRHSPTLYAELVFKLHDLNVQAAADTLTLETGARDLSSVINISMNSPSTETTARTSAATAVFLEEAYVRALSTVEEAHRGDRGVLASFTVSGMKSNVLYQAKTPNMSPTVRSTVGIHNITLSVPRSAVRLYRFVEDWKEKYLPKLDLALRQVVSEVRSSSTELDSPAKRPKSNVAAQVQFHIGSSLVALQVMRGTWLSWQLNRAFFHARSIPSSQPGHVNRDFGLKLASQAIGVAPTADLYSASAKARVKLEIPTILLMGRQRDFTLSAHVSMDKLHVTVKPSHLDTVLTVQQKFGHDFNDLMTLIQHTRAQKPASAQPPAVVTPASSILIKYNIHAKMRGIRIGLRGARSTLYLECEDIKGGTNNERNQVWQIRFTDIAVSMALRDASVARQSFNRSHRSAFIVIDLKGDGEQMDSSQTSKSNTLRVELSKTHAVLQPSSVAEIADFVNDLQAELRTRKKERAADIAEFKAKTLSIMRTFDDPTSEVRVQPAQSLLSHYTISFSMKNIGVAFPLKIASSEDMSQSSSYRPSMSSTTRAFLLSIRSIAFGSHLGESGQASVRDLSIQFVPQFRPSVFSDFDGLMHGTHNRLMYPEMTAHIRSEQSKSVTQFRVTANVSGFVLDLDSSLPDYVISLMDVYRHGKTELERIDVSGLEESPVTSSTSVTKGHPELPSSDVCGWITFQSGKIRVHSASDIASPRGQSSYLRDDMTLSDFGTDIIKLPEVSVWSEYKGGLSPNQTDGTSKKSCAELLFKSTIHSSQNTLSPGNILPFLSEFNSHLEKRMRRNVGGAPNSHTQPRRTTQTSQTNNSSNSSNLRISIALQIHQSRLELTCQPDVNVNAGVHWETGGFFVCFEPGMRRMAFSGAVKGLEISLRHGFLTEACAKFAMKNLNFSASLSRDEESAISLLVDTELVGGLRFSRLQDLLCFKAVWLDRIPTFNGPLPDANEPAPQVSPPGSEPSLPPDVLPATSFLTALYVRIRKLDIDVDLGQSISAVSIHVQQLAVQTRLTNAISEFRLHVGAIGMTAMGNISGNADVPDFSFHTTRASESALSGLSSRRMLQLEITSGPLNVTLTSEYQELLRYRADPVVVRIYDDWSLAKEQSYETDRALRLSFEVHGSTIAAAMTVSSIPRLMVYVDKFNMNMEIQREGASRESQAFRIAQAPKPDNALSAVAEAMLHSAKDRFSEAETAVSYVIQQGMSLRLQELRLALFPRRMDDTEMARFIGRGVTAQLERIVQPNGDGARRNLKLAFTSMAVSRLSGVNHVIAKKDSVTNAYDWLTALSKGTTQATIFGLPAMTMTMISDEQLQPLKVIEYDFESTFKNTLVVEDTEDIYISLNVSLYSWLTILRKNFAREMEDLQAAKSSTAVPTKVTKAAPHGLVLSMTPDMISPMSPSVLVRSPASFYTSAQTPVIDKRMGSGSSRDTAMSTSERGSAIQNLPLIKQGSSSSSSGPPPVSATASGSTDEGATEGILHRGIVYRPRTRSIERLTMRQLGEATPDVMHPFFMKKAGFNLEDALPQYVHEYATQPLEEIMKALLELYSKQLRAGGTNDS